MLQLMFPTHLAMGYLLGLYSKLPIAYFVLGSALPDLVDRPLYWLGLVPSTHALGHSIAVAVPACVVLVAVFGRPYAALAVGWLGHLASDFLNVLTTEGLSKTAYYVLYFAPPADTTQEFASITVTLPIADIGHTLHPLVLLLEGTILYWTLGRLRRDGDLSGRVRNAIRDARSS